MKQELRGRECGCMWRNTRKREMRLAMVAFGWYKKKRLVERSKLLEAGKQWPNRPA